MGLDDVLLESIVFKNKLFFLWNSIISEQEGGIFESRSIHIFLENNFVLLQDFIEHRLVFNYFIHNN